MSLQITVTDQQAAEIYRAAFDQVCNPDDWKAPIDCIVPWGLANLYMNAIEFMTGVTPQFERLENGSTRLTCIGYRMGPCGDH